MSTVDVRTPEGATAGTAELPDALFDVSANVPLIHQVVVAQLAAARQGTHSTKTRGEVRGGGKKPYRQKGTGRARQGSTRSPQFAGGGVAHGPQPHGYAQRTPKKMIAAALRGALSDRARDGRVFVLSELVSGEVPSTKTALQALATVASTDKVLVVLHRDDDLAWLSLRNVAHVHALAVDQLNAYDVLVNDEVVFTTAALDTYVAGPKSGRSVKAVASSSEAQAPAAEAPAAEAPVAEAGLGGAGGRFGGGIGRADRRRVGRGGQQRGRGRGTEPGRGCGRAGSCRRTIRVAGGEPMSSVKIRDHRDILLAPVVSEKSYELLDENKYTFLVRPDANKTEIKIAVETVFKVHVTGVNTLNRPGKKRRTRTGTGKRPDTKRAIVTVADGQRIDIFSAPAS